MRIIVAAFILITIFSTYSLGEDSAETNATQCAGTWAITNISGWAVRNDKGVILPLSPGTTILGCQKKPISLYPELSGAKAEIICRPSPLSNGIPDVVTVTVICE